MAGGITVCLGTGDMSSWLGTVGGLSSRLKEGNSLTDKKPRVRVSNMCFKDLINQGSFRREKVETKPLFAFCNLSPNLHMLLDTLELRVYMYIFDNVVSDGLKWLVKLLKNKYFKNRTS